jgi:hypothetical protein
MESKDSGTNRDFVIVIIIVICVILVPFIQKIQKFESDTKTFFLSLFNWKTAIFVIIIVLFFFLVKTIISKITAKKNAKIWEEQNKFWQKERKKGLREEKRRIKKERELIKSEEIELPENQYKTTPEMYKESKIREGQKAYLENELGEGEIKFLTTSGFVEVEQTDLDGKKNFYLVFQDKFESPVHIICIKEIVDYLKQFTQDIQTYRTIMPDIVFEANAKKYAIEVETGEIIRDKKKMQNKISLLKRRYGNNWFFFVTNRNLEKEYSKLGETSTKRNIKSKIDKIFKNSGK